MRPVRWIIEIIMEMYRRWNDHRVGGLAAEIAFWVVLSIFPGLLIFAATLGWMDSLIGASVAADVEQEVIEGVELALGSDSGPVAGAVEELFESPNTEALTLGALLALFGFARGFNSVVRALDIAYSIEVDRSWFHARVTAILLGIGSVFVGAGVLLVLFVGPLFGREGELGSWYSSGWASVSPLLAFVALVAWSATIFHVAPLNDSPWRWELPGAVFASVFWVAATIIFQLYIDTTIGGSNAIVGAVGGVLSLLLWGWVMSIGLMLGGELNDVLARRAGIVAHQPAEKRTVRAATRDLWGHLSRSNRRGVTRR